jgi:hypothetical protein
MSYVYDVFFSYKRHPESDDWHEKVKDKLQFWLMQELKQKDVRIFFDRADIPTGARWPNRLTDALRSSKAMVCVWSPLYFLSKWCVSEWKTFAKREDIFRTDLVVPASYYDGDSFPATAKIKQMLDFSDYTSTAAQFWNTERADRFEDRCLKRFAKDVASMVKNAPPFSPDFPLEEAKPEDLAQPQDVKRPADD